MARTMNMQRTLAPVLAALLLLAAVAPLCLMFAPPAMAMGAAPMTPSPECDEPGGSMSSCPYAQDEAPAALSAIDASALLFVALAPQAAPLSAVCGDAVAELPADASPPSALQVPLRI